MANGMNGEIVESIDMTDDEIMISYSGEIVESIAIGDDQIISYSGRVNSLIRSETASNLGDSPLLSFASRVDRAIRSRTPSSMSNFDETSALSTVPPRSFTLTELEEASDNFSLHNRIGAGSKSVVYRGKLCDGGEVAIKRGGACSNINIPFITESAILSRVPHHKFILQINYVGQLYHPNLVKLIGYCLEDNHRILVYEFMAKGSLDNHLFTRGSNFQPLSWTIRKKVALDVAMGLEFLQSDEVDVTYRDFITSNILLDSNYNAKLSDFGFATNLEEEKDGIYSDTYLDTLDGIYTGRQTKKSCVYSFGVVLLELMSGRRALDLNRPISERNLVQWARPFLTDKREIPRLMDALMAGQYSYREAKENS